MMTAHAQNHKPRKGRALPDLPVYYYHTNFCDLLQFVEDRYQHVFEDGHKAFLWNFRELPLNAQYLYVRIAGRKGAVFDSRKLRYDEITNIDAALAELISNGFILPPSSSDLEFCLSCLTKPDLVKWMRRETSDLLFKASWKKQALIEAVLASPFKDTVTFPSQLIVQGYQDALDYISFLYFGRIEPNLQTFTLRDLGLVKTPDFKVDYSARFDSLKEAQAAYFYAKALFDYKTVSDAGIAGLIDSVSDWPEPVCDCSVNARDKLLLKLGRLSEKCQDVDTAITLYARSTAPLCNERNIRLRYKRNGEKGNDRAWVQNRLEALIDNPGSDNEYVFASDFYARKYKKKRTSVFTDLLRSSSILQFDEAFKHEPERAVKRYYEAQGFEAFRTENTLWKTLFGLLFWDELFGPESSGLHNSFDRMPAALKSGQFYGQCEARIEAKLDKLERPADTQVDLLKTVSRHHGTPNGIFRWSGRNLDKIRAFLSAAKPGAVVAILRQMTQDYRHMKDGFPDLMAVKDGEVQFVEVKAAGDVVRRNQLTRLMQLRNAGFEADIVRVEWIVDPNQTYVVVDVETTGGRAGHHRVTEIGAVKVRDGKVIDEWQTLLNPERSIPPFITRLTGISQDMVKDAPLFTDVADSFANFMESAIFVAHNVNFDYGFMSFEFKQTGRSFKHPKLCTVSTMRKHYPGYRSYSLKNLCAEFGIDLNSHHRALCDAKAAAELLMLVNDKRMCAQEFV